MRWSWKRPSVPEKYQQWLQENQWWLQTILLVGFGFSIFIAFRRGAWLDWTGFKSKTLWDWFDLLGVPLSLAILGYILQQQQQKRAEVLAKEQREIAADETKEEILQAYFDRLSVLLVDKNILAIAKKVYATDEENDETQHQTRATTEEIEQLSAAVDVIRARTLSTLRRFENDGERKSSVIRFLIEAEVVSKAKLDLRDADLGGANLEGANLEGANLKGANLEGANLTGTNLTGTKLTEANLTGAKLGWATLGGATLGRANLTGAYLTGATLGRANLYRANLTGAYLYRANLEGATLDGANLTGANLWEANLSTSEGLTDEQLGKALLCETKLPEGSQLAADRDCPKQ